SAESGVPTFRGEAGLWKRNKPEELATPGAFRRDPRLVWEWYGWRRELVGACAPNAAHRALARFQGSRPGVVLVTQNVDGLHERALVEEGLETWDRSLELHGSLFRVRCTRCGHRGPHPDPVDATSEETLPHCPRCGALLRPDVVWFGEPLDASVQRHAFQVAGSAETCLVVGTSAVVQPAASLPLATLEAGGVVVEVNPDTTPLTAVAEVSLRGPAARVLPDLLGPEHEGAMRPVPADAPP
ncbi:MAG TPA: NAD-dependent deacylase, partial [Longimicrobiales bacterium]|nr:NAD-dependent deacylase [Longimicrobiales bacterium]